MPDFFFFIQVTFQTVISTDGVRSFAAFIYSNDSIEFMRNNRVPVGFDAGDQEKAANLSFSESGVYVYRIDGMHLIFH